MGKGKLRIGIITHVAIFFAVGILITGTTTFFSQLKISDKNVTDLTEMLGSEIADEVTRYLKEYPSYRWLFSYWFSHSDEMEIEYDADYGANTETGKKCRLLSKRHPDLQLKYARTQELEALPEEDQKLFAEIIYSWLITRINQIKRAYHIDYLFCVMTDQTYETQFFVFSGADEDSVRGTNYEDVYPLGTTVTLTSASQRDAMKSAVLNSSHLADAGHYVDYYTYFDMIDDHAVLLGMTYNLSALKADVYTRTVSGTLFTIARQLVLSSICLALIYFFVLRPLKAVQQGIRLYQKTKSRQRVERDLSEIRSRNEIGQLAEDIISLAEEIDDHTEKIKIITAEKGKISTELSLAARIQTSMLPDTFPAFPDRNEFDLYALMDPAKEVGGDFYDFFLLDDDHLYLAIADVSGKGVPAALFMMTAMIILKNNAKAGMPPAKILTETNTAFCEHNREEMFVTVWLGILEISTGILTAANAGHEYPVLKQPGGRFELIKDRHGLVIGAMKGILYRDYTIKLEPGAKLFVYTDGIPEATNRSLELFGTDRLTEALNKEPEAGPRRNLENMRKAVDNFVQGEEQFDDMTMLCLCYEGPGKEGGMNGPDRKSEDASENPSF
ncbi:MAG: PP2C family protein-serine/threonine phosphatase [Parasporobacterium sp.]|nr:PP2C family protein-serine/threonine phosphatase [Parasporobacterium sp.]